MEYRSPYNSFNSFKGLLYRDWFDGILSNEFKPPIEVNIDPVNNCQLNCIWCNGKKIIDRNESVMMTTEHLMELIDFCANWGVKAVCFAGGGEAVLHPNLGDAFRKCNSLKLESALITNGLFMDDKQIHDISETARWVGVSVDCAKEKTFEIIKGINKFWEVTTNINKLVKYGAKEVTFKFLIHTLNQYEILDACSLAVELGCHRFHVRPISFLSYQDKEEDYDLAKINDQIETCFAYYDNEKEQKIEICAVRHKYEVDMHRRIRFSKCRASPLLCMFEANGDVSICIDRKGDNETRLCSHNDIDELREIWGSQKHKNLLKSIDVSKCGKCTMNRYQELLDAYEKDSWCVNFP